MRPLPGVRQAVEVRSGDVVLEPVRDAQDRIDKFVQGPQLVELHPDDRVRLGALCEQILDDLKLRSCLSNLPRPPHSHNRRELEIEPAANLSNQMARRAGLYRRGIAGPPGVLPAQVGNERLGQLRSREHRTDLGHIASTRAGEIDSRAGWRRNCFPVSMAGVDQDHVLTLDIATKALRQARPVASFHHEGQGGILHRLLEVE